MPEQPEAAATPEPPAAAATPEPPAAELTLERVKRAWELVLQRVQTSSASLYGMLRDSQPSELRGDRLTVSISTNFALMRAREPGNAELVAGAVESVLGRPLVAEFVLTAAAAAERPTEAAPARRRTRPSISPTSSSRRRAPSAPKSCPTTPKEKLPWPTIPSTAR